MKAVTNHEYVGACRYTGYVAKSIRLVLECGHENLRKASQGVPTRAHCRDCARASTVSAQQIPPTTALEPDKQE